jgi:hypothetical protein
MRADALVAPIEDILGDPRFFPAHIDWERDRLTLVETSRLKLAETPFLDGRTDYSAGRVIELQLSEAVAAAWRHSSEPKRFIFHVAFCGSTLLATLLDTPGRCFAEREPNVLVELANAVRTQPPALVQSALDLVLALLNRPWSAGERNICKPSNWANSLLPVLTADPHATRPLFLAATKRDHLHALFRGGRERIAYVLRSIEHLLKNDPRGTRLWEKAFVGQCDPLELAARIALVGLHVQLELFSAAMQRGGWTRNHMLTLEDIEQCPMQACELAARALDLDIPAEQFQVAVRERGGRHAKDPSHAYSPERQAAENAQVERLHGPLIDRVLDWSALVGLRGDVCAAFQHGSDKPVH